MKKTKPPAVRRPNEDAFVNAMMSGASLAEAINADYGRLRDQYNELLGRHAHLLREAAGMGRDLAAYRERAAKEAESALGMSADGVSLAS